MTSDNVLANFSMQRKLLSVFNRSVEGEYITALQEKHIHNRPCFLQRNSVIVGDFVLIKEESIQRVKWHKGKIMELIHGNDGQVREVKLNIYQTKLKKNCYYELSLSVNSTIRNCKRTTRNCRNHSTFKTPSWCWYYLSNDHKLNWKGAM